MKTKCTQSFAVIAGLLFVLGNSLHAQVPQLINYQGRVVAGSTNFNGTGQFKFALVNAAGTTAYWTNDGTHLNGTEPTNAVSIPVSNGLYSVLLGDTSLTNMTAVPAIVFNNSDVRLRVWFNDGTHGSQQLTPDQRIAAVGYAVIAGNVSDGAITSAKIANGAVGASQLASGAAAANLGSSGQAGVASGGVVLSGDSSNAALLAAGYVKFPGSVQAGSDHWSGHPIPSIGARSLHTAVWTGSEMIVWGGGYLNDGARFNPATNTWNVTNTAGAPAGRDYHTAVWTGSEMIVWGGFDGSGSYLNDGGRYNPLADSWTTTQSTGAPTARTQHTAVWTGSEMIIWGGNSASSRLNDGGRYKPAANSWTTTQSTGAPPARVNHTAVWTGSEMIVWGGFAASGSYLNDGGRYNPAADSWTTVTTNGAPTARAKHTAVWTGSEMIIWGGGPFTGPGTGGRYNPTTSSWRAVTTVNAPGGRFEHTAVWTGNEMIVWGGADRDNTGARYDPLADSWGSDGNGGTLPTIGAPAGRFDHTAIWTGSEMIIFGGQSIASGGTGTSYNDAVSYFLPRLLYLYQKP